MLEIADSLLKILKESVLTDLPVEATEAIKNEKLFQESLIGALYVFAVRQPDNQKIEIMSFMILRTPLSDPRVTDSHLSPSEIILQHMLLKCLLEVILCLSAEISISVL